ICLRDRGWEPWADELWLLDSDGTLSARPLADLHSVRSVASPEPPVRLHTLPHRLLMEAERCLLEAAAPAPQSNHIIFQGEMPISSRQRLRAVEVGLAASFLTGTLTVGTHHGAGARHALPVVTLQVTGAVNAPLKAAFIAPPARYATVTIEATASSDFTLHYIHLTLA
ncbi:MAG: hypothetical protein K2M94_08890, partial [Paramuribaculum sp.]|nr:hypothetical protein [Paramuribaculum sp.]